MLCREKNADKMSRYTVRMSLRSDDPTPHPVAAVYHKTLPTTAAAYTAKTADQPTMTVSAERTARRATANGPVPASLARRQLQSSGVVSSS